MSKITKNISFNKIIILLLFIVISGMFIGIFSTNNIKNVNIKIIKKNLSYLKIFLNAFTLNYWYFFLIWFFGLIPFGFIINCFITFFKSFSLGVTLGICLKASAIFGIKEFLSFCFLELLIIIPLLIFTTYQSFKIINNQQYKKQYLNQIFITTFIIILFAILTCLKMTFMEV